MILLVRVARLMRIQCAQIVIRSTFYRILLALVVEIAMPLLAHRTMKPMLLLVSQDIQLGSLPAKMLLEEPAWLVHSSATVVTTLALPIVILLAASLALSNYKAPPTAVYVSTAASSAVQLTPMFAATVEPGDMLMPIQSAKDVLQAARPVQMPPLAPAVKSTTPS